MRKPLSLLLSVLLGSAAFANAQTEAPPELEHPTAPEELPPLQESRPRVNGRLQVEFVGATAFPERRLREGIDRQVREIEKYGLDEPNAYDAGFFLESFYRKNGYADAEVTATITGPWQLRLSVDQGPLVRLGEITVKGNTVYDTETIEKYLLGPTRERFPRIRDVLRLPYVDVDIRSGADLVRRLYASEGYLDAEVSDPEPDFSDDGTVANIALQITEGIQYRFGTIKFEGPLVFPREDLLAAVAEQTKNIFTPGRLLAAERALEDYYRQRGYFTATVQATGDPMEARDGVVPVTIQLQPGIKYFFDGVAVTGNSGVKTAFIQRRLASLSGQTYDPARVDRGFRELIDTGLFRNVRITPTPVNGNQLRLDVAVDEAKPREFGIGVGYATYDGGIVSLSYADRNLFGTGRPLTIEAEINQRGYNGQIKYSDPWFLETDYELEVRAYGITRDMRGFTKNELGFRPSIKKDITDHWQVSAFALAEYNRTSNILITPESLVGRESYPLFAIGLTQSLDYRNNKALPTSGYIFTSAVDFAPTGLGSVAYIRGVARFSYYVPITARSSLAIGARGGIISSLTDEALPIDERFFNGGATTVRSFSEYTLGPRDKNGYPLGGEAFTVFNLEYTFPIIGDLFGAVFTDAGNVISDAANFGLEDMRYAVGAGLRYNLPIGSIRLDYGLNPSPRDGEAQGAWNFAIGVAF
ncbi:MAG: outer membrane protein assembly factor BamA [Cupriavidus sp.]|nr:MAG: outer membrane protein assembly factor BamA [Cupriavidus sp.]